MKKIICLIVLLLTAASVLAGCQTKEASSTSDEVIVEASPDEAIDAATPDEAVESDDFSPPETVSIKELMVSLPALSAGDFESNQVNGGMLYHNGLLYEDGTVYDGKGGDIKYSNENIRYFSVHESVILYAVLDKDHSRSEIWAVLPDGSCRAKLTSAYGYAAPLFIDNGLLYYTEGEARSSLNTFDLDTGEKNQILSNSNVIMNIGKKVYFTAESNREDDAILCCYDPDSKEQIEIYRLTEPNGVLADHHVLYFANNSTVYRVDPQTDSAVEYVQIAKDSYPFIVVNGTVVYEEATSDSDRSMWAVSDTQQAHKLFDTQKSHFCTYIGDAYILDAQVTDVGVIHYYFDGKELKEDPPIDDNTDHKLVFVADGKFFYRDDKTILMSTVYVDEDTHHSDQ